MLKLLFFALVVRPFVLIATGVHVRGREHIPMSGACIVAANHNSHLDTLVLMSLFPLSELRRVRPVAAADYFMTNRLVAWFSRTIIGIIPLERKPSRNGGHPLAEVEQALREGSVVILFPEGSRGEPEAMKPFKTGVAHLAKALPEVPVVPVCLYGAGKSLPKGEALFVPFVIDVGIAPAVRYEEESTAVFTEALEATVRMLCEQYRNHQGDMI